MKKKTKQNQTKNWKAAFFEKEISRMKRESWGETPHISKDTKDEDVPLLFSLPSTHRKWDQMEARGKNILPGRAARRALCYQGRLQNNLEWTVYFEILPYLKEHAEGSTRLTVALKQSLLMKNKKQEASRGRWMTAMLSGKGTQLWVGEATG